MNVAFETSVHLSVAYENSTSSYAYSLVDFIGFFFDLTWIFTESFYLLTSRKVMHTSLPTSKVVTQGKPCGVADKAAAYSASI